MLKNLTLDAFYRLKDCIYISASLYVALLAGLVFFKIKGKDVSKLFKNAFLSVIVALVILIIPVSASLVRVIVGVYYDSQDIWNIIPLIPLGAFMCALLIGELADSKESLNKGTLLIVSVLLAAAVLICGTLGREYSGSATSPEKASEAERHIAEYVCNDLMGETQGALFASDEITAYVHSCSGNVATLYGRDMWDGRLTKNRFGTYTDEVRELHEDMKEVIRGEYETAADVCHRAFDMGAGICIMPGACDEVILADVSFDAEKYVSPDGTEFIIVMRK